MSADVVLLLEGTYPYIRGGVSSWVHQIILGKPELKFHIVFLGGHPSFYGDMHYDIPDNVVGLDVYYLMDHDAIPNSKRPGKIQPYERWSDIQDYFHHPVEQIPKDLMQELFLLLGDEKGIPRRDFLYSYAGWESLANTYLKFGSEHSFTHFFWTYRNLYAPLWTLANVARKMPEAKLYHSVSTGYAGFLGAGASLLHNIPLLISEHGIYTKERKIDLAQAEWIPQSRDQLNASLVEDENYIRHMWVSFFEQLGGSTYQVADKVISLYYGNRQRQLHDGPPPGKTFIIPNGINIPRFEPALAEREDEIPLVAGLIGRVVSIKDIKTFIRSIMQAQARLPELEGWVIGPFDEDPPYYEECVQLVASLDMQDKVKFLGMQNITDLLPKLGLNVLTSISEAQPLVLLEGLAAGVPFVATDVGSCRQIAFGDTPDDRALGLAGSIVPIASPLKTANAICDLLSDKDTWYSYQQAGLQRVAKIYDEKLMHESYKNLYQELM